MRSCHAIQSNLTKDYHLVLPTAQWSLRYGSIAISNEQLQRYEPSFRLGIQIPPFKHGVEKHGFCWGKTTLIKTIGNNDVTYEGRTSEYF